MTVDDHAALFAAGSRAHAAELDGAWRMDAISNANHAAGVAYLQLQHPSRTGGFEARYQLMGLMEGLVVPSFLKDHFQLNDFTPFHDEIRKVAADFLVGKYVRLAAAGWSRCWATPLGLFHTEADGQFGFYYMLTRAPRTELPGNTLLRPFLDVQLPDGIGMTFDEEMVGVLSSGGARPTAIPCTLRPASFNVRMVIRDVNEFVDGYEHEAQIQGTITFGDFDGPGPAAIRIDETPAASTTCA